MTISSKCTTIVTIEGALLPPATKLGQGYIFTGVCDSVHRGLSAPGGVSTPGEVSAPGGSAPGGSAGGGGVSALGGAWWKPPRTATAAGGTHPTGMHSCLRFKFWYPFAFQLHKREKVDTIHMR